MTKINGNIGGIRQSVLSKMEGMYDMHCHSSEFISAELVETMCEYTGLLGHEISVYIGRDGRIKDVSIGDANTVSMPNMRLVRNIDRLCGVRCIHTHPNGDGRPSGVDLGTLRSMRLDCMASIGVRDGKPAGIYCAFLGELVESERSVTVYGPYGLSRLPHSLLVNEIYNVDDMLKSGTKEVVQARKERAILVGIENSEDYDTLDELAELAATAGAEVVGRSCQRKRSVDNATYIGSGKADELKLMGSELEADLFIFDDELSAIQIKNLENILGAFVIDRTTLILDIFASRAQSKEGRLQVELAQLKYRLPRLLGQGRSMSRLGGGIGTRGPGEKKLEIDRRRISRRIFELEQELGEIEKQRSLRRERRNANTIPLVSLVGYTNAGKSTLLNALSGSSVLAEDMLFATLDTVVRQIQLNDKTSVLLSDTVGFINKLPHELVKAFRSTLEEVAQADVILHVVDCTSDYYETQMKVVEDVLASLGVSHTPVINVYNKCDRLKEPFAYGKGDFVCTSALNGAGLDNLLAKISEILQNRKVSVELVVPYSKYDTMNLIRSEAVIITEEHDESGTKITALVDKESLWKIKKALGDA